MRPFDELTLDLGKAIAIRDVVEIEALAEELAEVNTPESQAHRVTALGIAHHLRGRYSEAMEHHRQALSMFEELGDRQDMAVAFSCMGIVFSETGALAEALEHFTKALAIHEELGQKLAVAQVTGNIGTVYAQSSSYPEALELFRRGAALCEEAGERGPSAQFIVNIGATHAAVGSFVEALEHYRKALEIYEEVGDKATIGGVLNNIGTVLLDSGSAEEALGYLKKARETLQEIGNTSHLSLIMGNIVEALLKLGRLDEAELMLEEQEQLSIDTPTVKSSFLANRSELAALRGELSDAESLLHESLAVAEAAGLRSKVADFHVRLRDLAQLRKDFDGYIEHNNEYLRITEEIRGTKTAQRMAMIDAEDKMEAERRDREKERAVLYSALPKDIADRVVRGEAVTGDHFAAVSVIFLDIAGFTSISDKIPPGHVVHLLEQIFSALDDVVEKHGVTKIKTIGDSYMAAAGVPEPLDDHAQRAARCALDMLTTLNDLHIAMPTELGDTSWTQDIGEINVRIGIHCGPVTAGVIGTKRMQYDVWGDTVNVASRMESTGEPGRIQVSEAIASALGDQDGVLEPRGEVDVKGKGAMNTFWLKGAIQ